MLAYFGYPRAHDDDAERAVRAGMTLVRAIAKLDSGTGERWRVRVGVATGSPIALPTCRFRQKFDEHVRDKAHPLA
ncbi:hypothetical protein [Caballeronia arationis]|uniref:hypothetical protein n=1 Tax=Caballeronia arationis TaxID=1777142 RepID=UPI001F48EBCB|nr:hypothetical protein [Caballeronia arationis]